jgi:predicted transcriptional regulator of viral defense system
MTLTLTIREYNASRTERKYILQRRALEDRLYEVAAQQGGFFTARQAKAAGYADNRHPHHVRVGNWIRERRGIYRLARFPLPSRPDLILWQLWSHNRAGEPQGTYSHRTALTLYGLSDVMPSKLDMTVPPGFQRMAAIPTVLRLRKQRLDEGDVETIDGVRVTTPLRTLVDTIVAGQVASEFQVQAVQDAIRLGLVTLRQLDDVQVSRRAARRLGAILKQVRSADPSTVQHGRSVSNRSRNAAARTRKARRR